MNLPPQQKSFYQRFLIITLLVIVVSCFLAFRIQTSGGDVNVQSIKMPTQNGQWVVADLFRPKSATKENPAPLVVVIPGFQRSKEALSNVAIELSRRGIVAVSIDPYAQGFSSSSMSPKAATTEGYGMFALVEYFANTDNLNYIDKNRIGATGHSAGGNAVIAGASYFGKQALKTGQPSKLHSAYCSGYVLCMTEKNLRDIRSNVGMAYALYDEGSYRNELKNADMRYASESLRLVNMSFADSVKAISEVSIGQYYGAVDARNLRVIFNEKELHPFQPYTAEAMANQIAFFEKVFDLESGLAHNDQTWYWKELLGLIALITSFVSLIPMARLLLSTPYFESLVHPVPPALPRAQGKGRLLFWGLFALGALIACFSFIPMAELSKKLFVAASTRHQTWFFPQRMNNAVMLWAILNGSVGYLLFFLSYNYFGKKNGVSKEMWGTKTSRSEILRTLGLALTIYFIYYLLLFSLYYFFHVDYRFLFMGVRIFQPEILLLLLIYGPIFFIFFSSNSLRTNAAMRVEGQAEWKSLIMAGIGNSLGLFLIVLVQYTTFALTGTVYWTVGWLYVNLLFAVVPLMFFLPIFNRYFFYMTGRIYLGPMVTCLIFITILLTNTVVYFPL
ncbi:MAG: alpha/beta hydrolase [Candidatus Marinimicrobia bacterium]|jgi:hypothetical protein|nr:alpha/beta hydrolase [Candidatus Neomarinimicrobiota bacterium]MBT3631758.1 alpha/beta hydrolase [Candidatus Neomarinimicrobiota bacterium]MBT3824671.1 alpha/beta hydrolase [Candidatus Neomarinimicrobiota bacterium]MBT4034735.1 alpha/beta hydrolase [Candidatus Neomarinimicrobiota bacterium]MBT4295079.1 alpha/beta hydrolase [Candidatus Neomarinimicrobiota bacterium]